VRWGSLQNIWYAPPVPANNETVCASKTTFCCTNLVMRLMKHQFTLRSTTQVRVGHDAVEVEIAALLEMLPSSFCCRSRRRRWLLPRVHTCCCCPRFPTIVKWSAGDSGATSNSVTAGRPCSASAPQMLRKRRGVPFVVLRLVGIGGLLRSRLAFYLILAATNSCTCHLGGHKLHHQQPVARILKHRGDANLISRTKVPILGWSEEEYPSLKSGKRNQHSFTAVVFFGQPEIESSVGAVKLSWSTFQTSSVRQMLNPLGKKD